jgi:splicing factor 3B subunit 3
MVDYDTVAGGDKFGNFFINRLPANVSEESDDDPAGGRLLYEKGYLGGAPHRVCILFCMCLLENFETNSISLQSDNVAHYFVGDILSSLHRTTLVSGGRDVLLYTTFLGSIGIFVPFVSKEDVDFFQTLEMHMRSVAPPLAGRDHLAYRGYYVPVHNVIDGDLCEQYNSLPAEKKRSIAEELDRTVMEVQKKIEDMRIRSGY